jgi:hypothetical protein
MYSIRIARAKRSWINTFFWLLEILLHNVMVIYNWLAPFNGWDSMNQKEVRTIIALCLVGDIKDATVFNSKAAHKDLLQDSKEVDTESNEHIMCQVNQNRIQIRLGVRNVVDV